jgi:hypothetical protein
MESHDSTNLEGQHEQSIAVNAASGALSDYKFCSPHFLFVIQGGVFLPIKSYSSSTLAMFLTFVISGLYHEYVWLAIFYNQKYLYDENGDCIKQDCYLNEFGRVTAFFTYVGFVMLLERPVGRIPLIHRLSKRIPTPVLSQCLILIHLPVVQWYVAIYVSAFTSMILHQLFLTSLFATFFQVYRRLDRRWIFRRFQHFYLSSEES